jgi:hypothetical protein
MIIRGASGFGDALYLYPIIKHYINKGKKVIVKTNFPEIYENLNCECIPYDIRQPEDIYCNYCSRKRNQETSQFEDMYILAGIKEKIDFEIDTNYECSLVGINKSICIIQKPYFPMNELQKRYDLMPDYNIIQRLINDYKDKFFFIQVGKTGQYEDELIKFSNVDLDYTDRTDIKMLLGLINISDIFITSIGWGIAAAEALNKKVFVLFAQSGLNSSNKFFSSITPKKVITKKTSFYSVDNEPYEKIKEEFENAIK